MKKVMLLLISVFAFSFEINFHNVSIDNSLKTKFTKYWTYRANREFSKTYKYELPYLQYIHSKEWYEDFFMLAPRIKKIDIKNIKCKNNICFIGMILKIGKNKTYFRDKWIKVDKIYYHRFNDNPLPM